MRILLVDEHMLVSHAIKRALCEHDVVIEADMTSAMSHFDGELGSPFDLVLCDYDINGMTGHGLLAALRQRRESPPVILMSEYVTLLVAANTHADAVLCKPVRMQDLRAAIANLRRHVPQRKAHYLTTGS